MSKSRKSVKSNRSIPFERTAPSAEARESYHHGNLRAALIAAAQDILSEEGVAALTLRAAARRAGVSQAAPYRHFADKEALVAAVAEAGFRTLSSVMRDAAAAQSGDRLLAFRAVGLAYIRFAVEHPARFRLMFGREAPKNGRHADLDAAANETLARLTGGIAEGQRLGTIRQGDPRQLAISSWSMVHGLSSLLVDGQIPFSREDVDQLGGTVLMYLFVGIRNDAAGVQTSAR